MVKLAKDDCRHSPRCLRENELHERKAGIKMINPIKIKNFSRKRYKDSVAALIQ